MCIRKVPADKTMQQTFFDMDNILGERATHFSLCACTNNNNNKRVNAIKERIILFIKILEVFVHKRRCVSSSWKLLQKVGEPFKR